MQMLIHDGKIQKETFDKVMTSLFHFFQNHRNDNVLCFDLE